MKKRISVPEDVTKGWQRSRESHAGGSEFPPHYHDVEEWLQVRSGAITFHPMNGPGIPCAEKDVLNIPMGEVHKVDVGPDGVAYDMWVPARGPGFYNTLDPLDLTVIDQTFQVPNAENEQEQAFLQAFVAEELTFRAAPGSILDRAGYLGRPPNPGIRRKAGRSVRILHKSADSLLLSTVVHTRQIRQAADAEPNPQWASFTNIRLFVMENGAWKCRAWLNHPEAAPEDSRDAKDEPGPG